MEINANELNNKDREMPLADLRSFKRKFRNKKKQKSKGRLVVLEIQEPVHGSLIRRK